jgi:signal transduction histidine kinase
VPKPPHPPSAHGSEGPLYPPDAIAAPAEHLAVGTGGRRKEMAETRDKLSRRNRELEALHAVALDIVRELGLDVLLQKIVDRARVMLAARYGALSVIDGENRIERFFTSGLSKAARSRMGDPPTGRGLLGVPLHQGQSLRLDNLNHDPRRTGFPPGHPPMTSLLAVPLPCKGPFRGNLYLSDKRTGTFTEEDQEILTRLGIVAAIAIDNAFLHQQARALAAAEERLRIAREMHDGLAQVLAYVNAKAQAVRELLRTGRATEAERHLDQLAAAARSIYADTRDAILDLRTAAITDQPWIPALRDYLERWQVQNDLPVDAQLDDRVALPPGVDHQVLRIVQEALANVRKHARARRVQVEIRRSAAGTRVLVADDGIGFGPFGSHGSHAAPAPGDRPSFGLTTMRERATAVGATLRIESAPGQGTRVELLLPS